MVSYDDKSTNLFVRCVRAGLGHNTFTAEALALIVRSGEGLLRRTRNLCLSALIEAIRARPHHGPQASQPRPPPTPLAKRI